MIQTQDLSKRFADFLAVDRVTLQLGAGQVLALLGPNGAGKTTTVRMLTSVLRPTAGWARVCGYDVVAQPEKVRACVGVLTEQHGLYGRMRGDEYLDFFGQIYGLAGTHRSQRIHSLFDQFGMQEYAHRRIGEYSKGMRQKLALARALLHEPPVLLLDEPSSAMDPESARTVRDAILELRSSERAIILCTHNLAEAEELADQIAIIRRGKIIVQGSPAELKQRVLGLQEFELKLAGPHNGTLPELPASVELTGSGPDTLRYRTSEPQQDNPEVLRAMLAGGYPVMGLQEVPRSLEDVYLRVISADETQDLINAG
ncbi:MAG TPA: ABC transporter ATP-binding protein [Anaerolineales bacterium]|nr:ABC transporter ATP-binding protein [Anaerolineales bacterium]